jgi:hypothetical protein
VQKIFFPPFTIFIFPPILPLLGLCCPGRKHYSSHSSFAPGGGSTLERHEQIISIFNIKLQSLTTETLKIIAHIWQAKRIRTTKINLLFSIKFPVQVDRYTRVLWTVTHHPSLQTITQKRPPERTKSLQYNNQWDVTHRRLVVTYRRFGTSCQPHLQGAWRRDRNVLINCLPIYAA